MTRPDAPSIELLAPAGDFACLEAALDAGADAVYLGLTSLNARRRARNFSAAELARACELAHRKRRRIYLTLNIDLAWSELSEAARSLEIARRCGVDAVLVRDPALLALKRHFPELEFHFSTQACIANSADVDAARELGIARVVLARELSESEIAEASRRGVETEVFAQGALCFSISGRCLLASWGGGRSGNRGGCTSPCRVPWTADGRPAGTPLSMHDLSLATRVDALRRAGVRSLKIEGRLKTATWVRAAVSLFRKAIDGTASLEELAREAETLGAYTGRKLTSGYFDGKRDDLTGESGREQLGARPEAPRQEEAPAGYSLAIEVGARICCRWSWGERSEEWDVSRAEIRRAEKSVSVAQLFERLRAAPVERIPPADLRTNEADTLLVPRTANAIEQRTAAAVRRALKARKQLDAPLSEELEQALRLPERPVTASTPATRARLDARDLAAFLRTERPSAGIIVEGLTPASLETLVSSEKPGMPLVVALPPVLFEGDLPKLRALLESCRRHSLRVEVNGWGAWRLAKEAQLRIEGGPGLGVLNPLAARQLGSLGFESVTASVEADSSQLTDLLARSPVPCALEVFGRPALAHTRAELPSELLSRELEDRREIKLRARAASGHLELRPVQPFDLRGSRLPRGAARLVVDLVGSPDPLADWRGAYPAAGRFNFERTLA